MSAGWVAQRASRSSKFTRCPDADRGRGLRRESLSLAARQIARFDSELGEESIATSARDGDILRAERPADAFLGQRRGMPRVVEEPRAVVVPEVVVFVFGGKTRRELGDGVHDARFFLVGLIAQQGENKKPIWASDRFRFRERAWFVALAGDAHPSFRSIHRGRSRPGWQNWLFEGQFVPDASATVTI